MVVISWKTIFRPSAWSAGLCPHCQQIEPARIEDAIEVVSIYIIPYSKRLVGTIARCDFCERPDILCVPETVPLSDWSPAHGVETLISRLVPDADRPRLPNGDVLATDHGSEAALHSLLAAARESASINRVDTSFGLTTGLIVGAAAFLILASLADATDLIPEAWDTFVAGVAVSIFIGSPICGAILQFVLTRGRNATDMIRRACENYGVDIGQLVGLSGEYGGTVRRAACSVRDAV